MHSHSLIYAMIFALVASCVAAQVSSLSEPIQVSMDDNEQNEEISPTYVQSVEGKSVMLRLQSDFLKPTTRRVDFTVFLQPMMYASPLGQTNRASKVSVEVSPKTASPVMVVVQIPQEVVPSVATIEVSNVMPQRVIQDDMLLVYEMPSPKSIEFLFQRELTQDDVRKIRIIAYQEIEIEQAQPGVIVFEGDDKEEKDMLVQVFLWVLGAIIVFTISVYVVEKRTAPAYTLKLVRSHK